MTSPSDIPSVGELQVDQDMRFQNRMWAFQRAGWAFAVLIVVAAMLGLLGDGPLAAARARADDLEVAYGRMERHRSPSRMVVTVSTAVAEQGKVELWLDREFADRLRIQHVTPEPESVETSRTRVTFTFEVDESQPRARITYDVLQQGIGLQRGRVGVKEQGSVSFGQFVLP